MFTRYLAALLLTSLLGTAAAHGPRRHVAKTSSRGLDEMPAALYSRRALRRARTILQFKLLELRLERLDRVRQALKRHLLVNQILKIQR